MKMSVKFAMKLIIHEGLSKDKLNTIDATYRV